MANFSELSGIKQWGAVLAGLALGMTVLGNLAWRRVAVVSTGVADKEAASPPSSSEEPSGVLPPQAEAYAEPLTQAGPWLGWAALALAVWSARTVWPASPAVLWAGAHAITGACLSALWAAHAVATRRRYSARLAGCLFLGTVAVVTKREIVLGIIGGLFVLEAVSVIVQVVSFKMTGKRVFRMAPIHHHFEQLGWTEPQIVIRFWIIAVVLALAGLSTLKLR